MGVKAHPMIFFVFGALQPFLAEYPEVLRPGGKLVFSDVAEDVVALLNQCRTAGFAVRHIEDMTSSWRAYYLEALWTQEHVCAPKVKHISYVLFVCERM